MQSIVVLLVSLFAVLGARAQTAICPKPVVCVADPCDGARCPRFLNTECKVDVCHGECRATFFRLSDRREVTNRCAGPTCAQKPCPAGWTCINTVFPTACPRSRPNCRQYIKPQCVLPLQPQPPVDCSQVLCPPDRSFCEVRQTTQGPRARCVPQPPPTSCDNVECEKGMQCQVREREGARPVVRCVPIRVVQVPRDCSQLECSDGFMCVVMNSKAMCVETPSPPDECDRLACEEQHQECRIITSLDVSKAVCGPVSDCSKMSCNESECRVAGEGQTRVAFCTPTTNLMPYNESVDCGRISCNGSEGLECRVVGEGSGVSAVAVCLVTRSCSVLNPICRRGGLVCQEPQSQGEFAQASCVAPPSCEELECNPGFTCIDLGEENGGDVSLDSGFLPPVLPSIQTTGDLVTAVCIASSTQASCEAFPCKQDQVCFLQKYPSRSISLVTCKTLPEPPSCNNTGVEDKMCTPGTSCETRTSACTGGLTCQEIQIKGSVVGTVCNDPSSPVSCDNVKCASTEECLQSEADGEPFLAKCVPSDTLNDQLPPILSRLLKDNQPSTNSS